jgi:hypothetical protein
LSGLGQVLRSDSCEHGNVLGGSYKFDSFLASEAAADFRRLIRLLVVNYINISCLIWQHYINLCRSLSFYLGVEPSFSL